MRHLRIALPLQLFRLRKTSGFIADCGIPTGKIDVLLDKAAVAAAAGKYRHAGRLLTKAGKEAERLKSEISCSSVALRGLGSPVMLPEGLAERLMNHHYKGYITFEYKDDGREYLFVRSSTARKGGSFDVVESCVRTRPENGRRPGWNFSRIT